MGWIAFGEGDLERAGYFGAVLWAFLLLIPSLLIKRIERLSLRGEFGQAKRLAFMAALLHPTRDNLKLPRIFKSVDQKKKGTGEGTTRDLVTQLGPVSGTMARQALALRFALESDWEGLLEWADRSGGLGEFNSDPTLLTSYLRALGETRQLNELVLAFRAQREELDNQGPWSLAMARLSLFAFCGSRAAVRDLFAGALSTLPQPMQLFWLATAEAAAGNTFEAEKNFHILATASEDLRLRKGAERRINHPPAVAETTLRHDLHAAVYDEHAVLATERVYREQIRPSVPALAEPRPYATYTLIVLNCAMFIAEVMLGGSTNDETLFLLGGLLPEAVIDGQYWRLVAATFLHAGILHLGMNMFALRLVGPSIEIAKGAPRFLICYFGAGTLSMLTVTLLSWRGILHDQFLVGASGAIMGLIGVSGATALQTWHKSRTKMASQRLNSILMALLIQAAFDLSTPQVSMTAHLAGAAAGFLLGLLI
jgi:rhomboid protease GluP